jgi:hypothetical protein
MQTWQNEPECQKSILGILEIYGESYFRIVGTLMSGIVPKNRDGGTTLSKPVLEIIDNSLVSLFHYSI